MGSNEAHIVFRIGCILVTTPMRILTSLLLLAVVGIRAAEETQGEQIYKEHCAVCHDAGGEARVPPLSSLRQRTAGALMKALESGVMRQQGAALSRFERRAVTRWLGKTEAAA